MLRENKTEHTDTVSEELLGPNFNDLYWQSQSHDLNPPDRGACESETVGLLLT